MIHEGVNIRRLAYDGFVYMVRKLLWFKVWVNTSVSAPLMWMYMLLLMINTLLRDTKDTLLVTSKAGVEAIPILKSWVVIPCSMLYFVAYYKLSNCLNPRQMFMFILFAFTGFYFAFAIVLYPRQSTLIPTTMTTLMKDHLPENAMPLKDLVENWLLGIFYVVSELWASAVCQLLFWQVANDVVSVDHAKSIYPLIGACGNMGMVLAGHLLGVFANQRDIVAANAYLRISAAGGERLNTEQNDDIPKISIKHLNQDDGLYTDSLGYSLFSEWLAPMTGLKMNPLDQAWQGTLLGISLLMAFCSILIMVSYDSVHTRKAANDLLKAHGISSSHTQHASRYRVASLDQSTTMSTTNGGNSSSNSNNSHDEKDSTVVKRRTGSGGYVSNSNGAMIHGNLGEVDPSSASHQPQSPHIGPAGGGSFPANRGFWDLNGNGDIENNGNISNETQGLMSQDEDEKTMKRDWTETSKKSKPKVSLMEGLKTLSKSNPLRCAAILVASYGVAISLVEVSWKGQVKKALEKPNDYSRFMGMFWTVTGLVSMLFMLIGRVILHRIGYAPAVLFTPVCMAIAGSLFFLVSILQDLFDGPTIEDAVPWAAYFGGSAVLFAKSAKYAFFDATKEIIFIPLDESSKSIGKAAIDVVAYRLSKSGGSIILQIVIFFFGSISTSMGCIPIAIIFAIVVFAWIHAAIGANKFIHNNCETQLQEQHIV